MNFVLFCFVFYSGSFEKRISCYGKKYIKTNFKDKTLMHYQINFRKRLSFTKKRLESVMVESEKKLGLHKECLTKNIPIQVTSISGRIM